LSLGNLYKAIEKIESDGDPNAISPKGARGLMQVMPSTARNPGYGVRPARNQSKSEYVRVGKDYAKAMYNEFDGDIEAVLAAYNMGPGATKKWIERGRDKSKLPTETRKYIPKVTAELNKLNKENQRRAVMAVPLAGLVPVILGSGAYATIRAMAPAVVEKFIRAGIKGFRKVPANKLNSVPKNLKKVSESQAKKIIQPTPSRQGLPKVDKKPIVKKKVDKKPIVKKKVDKKPIVKKKVVKKKVDTKTTPTVKKKVDTKTFPTFKKKVDTKTTPTAKSNTTSSQKSPFKKTKSNNNTVVKTPNKGKKLLKNVAKVGLIGGATALALSPKNTGKATAKIKSTKKIDPTAGNKIRKDRKIPKGALDASGDVKAIPKPSSPFGPIETKVRNKFIKDRGGKDAFKSDKQIDSLFVNEMLNMREGSEGGYTYDDQKNYEAILEERKSRKAGGKVSKKVGGKVVKRSMGGSAKPKKKVVFRRGGGKALRGFGKATYSNKMY
jgi:hypothetical protein